MGPREETAEAFACVHHGEQKYGAFPYRVHLAAVRQALATVGVEPESDVAVAAWLHDVVEDTDVTRENVATVFGEGVARLVWSVTGVGATRAERVATQHAKLLEHPEAILLKVADRLANVMACLVGAALGVPREAKLLGKYKAEHAAFRTLQRLGTPAPERALWARLEAALA